MPAENLAVGSVPGEDAATGSEIANDDPMTEDGSVKPGDKEWVVTVKELLRPAIDELSGHGQSRFIFLVPEWIKNTTNKEAYRPRVVSLGPYHRDKPDLQPMDKHKCRAVWVMAKRMRQGDALNQLASVVEGLGDFLRQAYGSDLWLQDDELKEMMLMDGCFLLEILRVFRLLAKGAECDDYYPKNDPVFSRRGFLTLYLALRSDVIVMENQLPLLLLQRLKEQIPGEASGDKVINNMVLDFLGCNRGSIERLGLHPLDLLHLSFHDKEERSTEWGDWDDTMPSAMELAEAGIQFKKCSTGSGSIHDINFKNGILIMPEIEVKDTTEREYLNMMAYEQLYGNAGTNATALMIFMESIINSEKDVAVLRSNGILRNMLSSDEEAAKLFNTLSTGALLSPTNHLCTVRREVNKHCKKKWNTWRTNFLQRYLRDPIVFTAFVLSGFLIIATFLQTIYTVMPFYTKS